MKKNGYYPRLSLLTLTILSLSATAASPWHFDDGQKHVVDKSYESTEPQDRPLSASGINTGIEAQVPLLFSSQSDYTEAARITNGATLQLNQATLKTQGDVAAAIGTTEGHLSLAESKIATQGESADGLHIQRTTTNVTNTDISTAGADANAVSAYDSSLLFKNTHIRTSGSGSNGVQVNDGTLAFSGDVTLDNGTHAFLLRNNKTRLHDTDITLSGTGSLNGVWLQAGSLDIDKLRLQVLKNDQTDINDNVGIDIYRTNGAVTTITNSQIVMQNGLGIRIINGDLSLTNTDVSSQNAYALDLNINSHTTIDGGHFSSGGEDNDAVWITSPASTINARNSEFSTLGDHAIAVNNQGGGGTISDSTLKTSGNGSYGLYSESLMKGSHLTIATQGALSAGGVAARGGTLELSNSTSITTIGEKAAGLVAFTGSTVNADAVTVKTSGAHGWALWDRGGALELHNSQLATSGDGAAGIYSNTRGSGEVTLDNTQIAAANGAGLLAEGTILNLSLNNGSILRGQQDAIYLTDRIDDKKQTWQSRVGVIADNHAQIFGDAQADTDNTLNINLLHHSGLTGATTNVSNLSIDSSSQWHITGDSSLGSLKLEGQAAFSPGNKGFKTLTVADNLTGNGRFTLNTRLGDDSSPTDRLEVGGNATGDYQVVVNNKGGSGAQTDKGIPLIHVARDASGARFTQHGDVAIGNYEYFLNKVSDNDWYLQSSYVPDPIVPEPEPNPEPKPKPVQTLRREIAGYQISPWLNADLAFTAAGSWHLRQAAGQGSQNLWGRTWGQHERLSSGRFGYHTNTFFMQLGSDLWQKTLANGSVATAGIFATYSTLHSKAEDIARLLRPGLSARTGKIETSAWSIAGFYTLTTARGSYLDTLLQQTVYRTHFRSSSNAHQNSSSTLLSLETGYPFSLDDKWQLEPQLQLMGQWLHSGSTGAEGIAVTASNQAIGLGRAGLRLSYAAGPFTPWLQLDAFQRAGRIKGAHMRDLNISPDLQTDWWQASAGVTGQITPGLSIYASAAYQQSFGHVIEGYSGNLGLKYQF